MPRIQSKSPEKMQAQVSEFMRKGDLSYEELDTLKRDVGEIAAGDLIDVDTTIPVHGWNVSDGEVKDVYEDKAINIPAKKYIEFLRSGGEVVSKRTDFVAEKYKTYDIYRTDIERLEREAAAFDSPRDNPAFLGNGSNASAYVFEHGGQKLVARIPRGNKAGYGLSYNDAVVFEKGNKIKNLQHLVAASPESGVIITELLPGKNLVDLSYEELASISEEQLEQVISVALKMHDDGLSVDPKPSNYMYDPVKGVSILDYGRLDERYAGTSGRWLDALRTVRSLVGGVASSLQRNRDEPYDSPHNRAYSVEVQLNGMHLQLRLLKVLKDKFPEILRAAAEEQKRLNETPGTTGDVFGVNTNYLDIDADPQLKDYKEYLESLGLASQPR